RCAALCAWSGGGTAWSRSTHACASRSFTAITEMNRSLRPLHVLLLIAAGVSAFALARGLAVRETGPAVAEGAEPPSPEPSAPATAPEAGKSEPIAAAATAPEAAKSNAASVRPAFGAATAGDP